MPSMNWNIFYYVFFLYINVLEYLIYEMEMIMFLVDPYTSQWMTKTILMRDDRFHYNLNPSPTQVIH